MKRYLSIILFAAILAGCSIRQPTTLQRYDSTPAVQASICTVTKIVDGDTVKASCKDKNIRFCTIDAPERDQPGGAAASNALAEMVSSREVVIDQRNTDRYGRVVAVIRVAGKDVGLALVEAGYSWVNPKYLSELSSVEAVAYLAAEKQARSKHLGLWKESGAVPPWEWRQRKR